MHKLFHKLRLSALSTMLMIFLAPCLTACDLIELDFDSETQQVVGMTFVYDTVYVMPGDTFFLEPFFSPDTMVMKNIYMHSEYDSIVGVHGDTIYAGGIGETSLIATSVSRGISDTCTVVVMNPWIVDINNYYRDQVFYIDLQLGQHLEFNPSNMILAAFVGEDECCGVAKLIEDSRGHQRLYMRCWYYYASSQGPEIRFRLYYKKTLQIAEMNETARFDGEVHGTPSAPFILTPAGKIEKDR